MTTLGSCSRRLWEGHREKNIEESLSEPYPPLQTRSLPFSFPGRDRQGEAQAVAEKKKSRNQLFFFFFNCFLPFEVSVIYSGVCSLKKSPVTRGTNARGGRNFCRGDPSCTSFFVTLGEKPGSVDLKSGAIGKRLGNRRSSAQVDVHLIPELGLFGRGLVRAIFWDDMGNGVHRADSILCLAMTTVAN